MRRIPVLLEREDGPISLPLAQRIAADCAEVAATRVLNSTTPDSMPGLVCIAFRKTYVEVLNSAVSLAREFSSCATRRPGPLKSNPSAMTPTAEELLAIARNYFRPDDPWEGTGQYSPEAERWRHLVAQQVDENIERWREVVRAVQRELPDFTIGQITATCDSSFKVGAYPAKGRPFFPPIRYAVVGCLSVLAPIYTVYAVTYEPHRRAPRYTARALYGPLPAEMRHPAEVLARHIEGHFGATPLPPDIAATPIPLRVDAVEPPETTLFHAFCSSAPHLIP